DDDEVPLADLGAGGDHGAELVSLGDLGQPRDGEGGEARAHVGAAASHIPSARAVRPAVPRRASSSRVSAIRSAGVSRSSASELTSSVAKGTPASRAAASWRARLPSPNAGRITPEGERT